MKKHILLTTVLAMSLSLSTVFVSLAGQWQQNSTGWWYQEDNNSYPVNSWKELDGKWYYFNQDGYMVSNTWIGNYYLGSDGAMLTNTITPDGYKVGADGAWIQDTSLPVTEYANLINNYKEYEVNSAIEFSKDILIDHGDYYEIPNQTIYYWLDGYTYDSDDNGSRFLYSGSVYVYKNVIDTVIHYDNSNRNNMSFEHALSISDYNYNGEYYWVISGFDSKGYATTFAPGWAG